MNTASTIVTLSETFIYAAILLNGLASAVLVATVLSLSEAVRYAKGKPLVISFNVAVANTSIFLAGQVVYLFSNNFFAYQPNRKTFFLHLLVLLCFVLLHTVIHAALLIISLMLRPGKPIWMEWLRKFAWAPVTNLSGMLVAAIINALVSYYGFWALFSVLPLLAAVHAVTYPYLKNIEAARKHSEEMDQLHQRTLQAFATAVDAKDQITQEHVRRVQIYAEGLAKLLKLSELEIKALQAGALLQDIGKIAVPDFIINKPGKLTAFEFDKMKQHTSVGAQILDQIQFPYPLVPIVHYHHERWDGKGYPQGLVGDAIPLTARLLSIVDCFDAVREDSQYRKGVTREQAIQLLQDDRGKAFDPVLVDLFIENLPTFEAQIAQTTQDTKVFTPIEVADTQAIRTARPAAELIKEQAPEQPAFVKAIQESRRVSQESYALYEIAEQLAGKLNVQEICKLVANKMDNVIPFDPVRDCCVFYSYEEDSYSACAEYAFGFQAERFQGCTIKPGEGVTGWVLANHQPFANSDPSLDLYILGLKRDISDQFEKFNSIAVFPLSKNDDVFGALAIYSRTMDNFKSEEIDRLKRASALISESLWGAKKFSDLQTQAVTDALTGLPNARFLRECFMQEKRASHNDLDPLTLLLFDLSALRQMIDRIENARADQTIKRIADLVRAEIRGSDTLVHFLGDEFIVMLRNTPSDAVFDVWARIQGSIVEHRPSLLSVDDAMMGVSLGQAQIGRDGETLEKLLDAAQMRLQADRSARRSLSEAFAA